MALAAAGVAWMMWGPSARVDDGGLTSVAQSEELSPVYWVADIDQEIDAISLALDDFSEDLSTL